MGHHGIAVQGQVGFGGGQDRAGFLVGPIQHVAGLDENNTLLRINYITRDQDGDFANGFINVNLDDDADDRAGALATARARDIYLDGSDLPALNGWRPGPLAILAGSTPNSA